MKEWVAITSLGALGAVVFVGAAVAVFYLNEPSSKPPKPLPSASDIVKAKTPAVVPAVATVNTLSIGGSANGTVGGVTFSAGIVGGNVTCGSSTTSGGIMVCSGDPDYEFKDILRSTMPYELEGDSQARVAFRKWAESLDDQRVRSAYIEALDKMAAEEEASAKHEREAKAKREAILASVPRALCRHRAITREDSVSRGEYECVTMEPKQKKVSQ